MDFINVCCICMFNSWRTCASSFILPPLFKSLRRFVSFCRSHRETYALYMLFMCQLHYSGVLCVRVCMYVLLSVLLALITLNGADSWERIPCLICSHCVFGMITFPQPILSQLSIITDLRLLAVLTWHQHFCGEGWLIPHLGLVYSKNNMSYFTGKVESV